MDDSLQRGAAFIADRGRPVERHLFGIAFDGASWAPVRDAVLAHRNTDGGFGHALEPDLRTTSSQPIFVHFALTALREAGVPGEAVGEVVQQVCAYMDGVADESGAVPYVLPDALEAPHAPHWSSPHGLEPSLHATAAVAAGLHALGAEHTWLDRATAWCLTEIEGEPSYSGHRMLNVLDLLEEIPDRERGERLWAYATARLFEADYVQVETPVTSYGLTPLHFAPTPESKARALFAAELIEAHLDDLFARQESDGGWPIFWEPPTDEAIDEWRCRWTLDALRTLRAHGRI